VICAAEGDAGYIVSSDHDRPVLRDAVIKEVLAEREAISRVDLG